MNQLVTFNFEKNDVFIQKDESGKPIFQAKEVAQILEYQKTNHMLQLAKPDEAVLNGIVDSLGRKQEMVFLTLSGLFRVLMRTDKPKAEPFQDWLVKEVLPSIMATGAYGSRGDGIAEATAKLELADRTLKTGKKLKIGDKTALHQTVFDILASIRMPTERIHAVDIKTKMMRIMHNMKKSSGHFPDMTILDYSHLVRSVDLEKVQLIASYCAIPESRQWNKKGPILALNDGEKAEVMRVMEEHIYLSKHLRQFTYPQDRYEFFLMNIEMSLRDKDGWLYDYRKHGREVLALARSWINEKIPRERRYDYLTEENQLNAMGELAAIPPEPGS